jgi:hypothetical protein
MDLEDEFGAASDVLECYLMGDQPTTCGLCGSRTSFEIDEKGVQIHLCLNDECEYKFIVVSK